MAFWPEGEFLQTILHRPRFQVQGTALKETQYVNAYSPTVFCCRCSCGVSSVLGTWVAGFRNHTPAISCTQVRSYLPPLPPNPHQTLWGLGLPATCWILMSRLPGPALCANGDRANILVSAHRLPDLTFSSTSFCDMRCDWRQVCTEPTLAQSYGRGKQP